MKNNGDTTGLSSGDAVVDDDYGVFNLTPEELDDFEWIDDGPPTSTKPLDSIYQIARYILDPKDYDAMRQADGLPTITSADVKEYFEELTLADLAELDALIEQLVSNERDFNKSTANILKTAPYLFDGELPTRYMDRMNALPGREGENYAILINQTGCATVEEAREYIGEQNGIQLGSSLGIRYGVLQRFMGMLNTYLADNHPNSASNHDYLFHAITMGYFGYHNVGRFVVYAPTASSVCAHGELSFDGAFAPNIQQEMRRDNNGRPETVDVVVAKFLYCFIDNNGNVWVNENYLLSNEPNFYTSNKPIGA